MKRVDGVRAARHPAVRVRRLGGRRDAPKTAAACNAARSNVLVRAARAHAGHADLSFLARPEHGDDRARPAARLRALVLRLGARGRRRTRSSSARSTWLDDAPARRGRDGPQLGRRADRQHALRATSTRSPSSTGRWRRSGRAEVDLAWMIFLHAFFQDLAGTLRACPACPTSCDRAEIAQTYEELIGSPVQRPRVVRGVRRAALRHRVDPHEHARHRLRVDGEARRTPTTS